jgi:hypothetical protein
MRRFWCGGKGIHECGGDIIIRKGVELDRVGTRDIVEEELVDEVRVVSWLRNIQIKLALTNEAAMVDGQWWVVEC